MSPSGARDNEHNVWPRSRVLVTGGAGFIGSALVWGLNQRGCTDVVIADRAGRADRQQNLRCLRFSEYVPAETLLARLSSGSLGKFNCALHLGACSSTTETDADYLRSNNFEFSRDLAAWALAAGVRFVYASSAATYGNQPGGDDRDPRALENLQPLNPYGRSKQAMDLHAWRAGWLDRVVALKYFNVFGPNEGHKGDMRSMVNKSFEQARRGGVLHLFKSYRPDYRDGEQKRDFLYVKDAVAMTLHLAATPSARGVFNIGSGHAHSWNEMARALFAALDLPPRIEYIEMPAAIREQYQYFTQADIGKLRDAGYDRAITPLGEAVRDYVLNYLLPGKSLGEAAPAR
jgi:ADP-L-glycero-D-manno-heptose 6-epimerase